MFREDLVNEQGQVEHSRIVQMAEKRNISEITLRRAAKELKIIKERPKGEKVWWWSLPKREEGSGDQLDHVDQK